MPASRNVVDADGYVIRVYDLYHRTEPEAAQAILASGRFESHCRNTQEAYFTNMADGRNARHYGDAVVHVQVPTRSGRSPMRSSTMGRSSTGAHRWADPRPASSAPRASKSRRSARERGRTAMSTPRRRSDHMSPSPGALEQRRRPGASTLPALGLTP